MREFQILQGDALAVLRTLEPCSFDACLCDPPYGLGFMGKEWDSPGKTFFERKPERSNTFDHVGGNHNPTSASDRARTALKENSGFQSWCEAWARESFRVLKPGALLLAFGGTRTHHRLMCAIEDAGFEIRDCMMWLYGSGFPKSLDISKALDKAAGAERAVIGRRTDGRYAYEFIGTANRPTGGRAGSTEAEIIGGFVSDKATITAPATPEAAHWNGYGTALKPAWEPIIVAMKPCDGTFAENALKHGVAGINVDAGRIGTDAITTSNTAFMRFEGQNSRPWQDGHQTFDTQHIGRWPANVLLDETSARLVDGQSGESTSTMHQRGRLNVGCHAGTVLTGPSPITGTESVRGVGDSGGASRFFYIAKADTAERNTGGVRNNHPCVKPVDLCAYLAKLILPPQRETPRRLLVPFSGSGSEIMGALRAGWDEVVGIDNNAEYVALARKRIEGDAPLFNVEAPAPEPPAIQEALL